MNFKRFMLILVIIVLLSSCVGTNKESLPIITNSAQSEIISPEPINSIDMQTSSEAENSVKGSEDTQSENVLTTEKADNMAQTPINADGSSENPLFHLLEKNAYNITFDDMKLLLNTPAKEIDEYFNIISKDKDLWMMGITSYPPIEGISFCYGYLQDEQPEYLSALYLWHTKSEEKGADIPLGYTIEEILEMPQWGGTSINEFLYATGYCGEGATTLKELEYSKDDLEFIFRIDYNNVFVSENEQNRTIELIIISKHSA